MKKNAPCYGCCDRVIGCHANCDKFVYFRNDLDTEAQAKIERRSEVAKYRIQTIEKYRKDTPRMRKYSNT